jgi:hypothetical protein
MPIRTAQCACGRLQVDVVGEALIVSVCNCDFCQKRTGSVFQVSGYFAEDQLVEIRGEVKTYNGLEVDGVGIASGRAAEYHFCTTCGSTVYWTVDGLPGSFIAVGNFVDPNFPAPTIESWTSLRHHWVPPAPGAAQFETFPPGL